MIKLEKTTLKKRYNLVNTERKGDDYFLQQLSEEDAIYLLRSILTILLPIKSKEEKA